MGKYNKWLGAGAGWIFGGPIGGIIGFAIGALVDKSVPDSPERTQHRGTTQTDFAMSLVVLIAAVMKADGKVLRSELDYTKSYLVKAFGINDAQELLMILKDVLKREIPIQDVCIQIRHHLDYPSRLQLMHLLYGIAQSDGDIDLNEEHTIEIIGANLGISPQDCQSLKAMFSVKKNWAYEILEVSPDVSDEEVKKAYKKMAVKHHPDKVGYLGEEFQKSAKEKFQKINEAYEQIKKERGIK